LFLDEEVSVAKPGGRIATTEYDANQHVVRSLTAASRERALNSADSVTTSQVLDSELTYEPGWVLRRTGLLVPSHR
jgi:hypothetical protein